VTNSEIKTALNNSPLFQDAPEAALNMAIEAASVRRFGQGTPIFREDDPGEAVYVLVEGRVKVSRENLEGRERIFTILTPPEVVGEMALVSQLPRSATAHCIDNVVTLAIYRNELRAILDRHSQVLWNLAQIMAKRLADMNREVEMLSFASTQACVAYALQGLYLRGAFKTHQDLANRTGNSRETITRVLKDLENDDIISTRPGLISLLKPKALEGVIYGLREKDE
jgi:CRP/FNR family transcriptional regulator, cyclic AMP receptor protein